MRLPVLRYKVLKLVSTKSYIRLGHSNNAVAVEHTGSDLIGLSAPCVSVIIPTKDSGKTIGKCLASLKNQTYTNIEIFVVDCSSSDATATIVSQFGDVNLSILEGERTTAKNFGISKAHGEFLLFLDSDMMLHPQVIYDCIRVCLEDSCVAGVIIPEHSIGNEFWVRVRDYERSLYTGTKIESARFFRKKFVTEVGGFDEGIVAYEEATLPFKIERLGMNVNARVTSYIFHIEEGFKIGAWLRKKRYYSESAQTYSKKYRELARLQLSIYYRLKVILGNGSWKYLIKHPVLSIGLFILKSLEFFVSLKRYKITEPSKNGGK